MDIGQIIMWVFLILMGVSLVVFKDFIKKHQRPFELIIGVLLVVSRIWRGSGYIIDDEWQRAIPGQLCSISTYLALFYFLFKWKGIEKYLFFFGFLGLTSFIDPDVAWGEVRTGYIFGFVFDHLIITLAPLYLVLIKGFKFDAKKDIIAPLVITIILLIVSWPLFTEYNTNYFYFRYKPVFSDLFDEENFSSFVYNLLWMLSFVFAFFVFNAINLLIVKLVGKGKYLTNK